MKMTLLNSVKGPVIPLPIPFTKTQRVDYKGLAEYVQFLVKNGIQNIMTTVGTSRFNLLSEREIKQVNKVVVTASNGNAQTIVANPMTGGTSHAIKHAQHAKDIGANFLLVYFPERFYSEAAIYKHFQVISSAVDIPILIHEMPIKNGAGGGKVAYSIDLLTRLLELENVIGFKEEALDIEHSNKIVRTFKDKAIIIGAGGGMSRFLDRDFALGAKAYLGGIGNFYPSLELAFFQALEEGNEALAKTIVNEIERPYFEKVVPLGWHPTLKVAMATLKLMSIHERSPMITLNESQQKIVSDAVQTVLNNKYVSATK